MLLLRTRQPGVHVPPALLRWRRAALLILGAIAAVMFYWEITSFVAYTGDAYVTSDLVAVAPQVTGRIVAVYVRDNQTVRRGDKLVRIDPVPLELDVAAHRAGLAEANARAAADRDAASAAQSALDAVVATLQFAQSSQHPRRMPPQDVRRSPGRAKSSRRIGPPLRSPLPT